MLISHRQVLAWSLVLGISVLANFAGAQPPQGGQGGRPRGGFGGGGFGGGGPGGGGGEMGLLASEQVQKELELLPDQIADFTKLREETGNKMREQFAGMRELSDEQRRAKFEELRPAMEKSQKELRDKMSEILLPHQRDRLKEINIQVQGFGALDDEGVAAELKLSDDQKKQLAELREGQREKMGEMFRNRGEGGGNDEDRRAQFTKLRTELEEKALAVLSSEQRAQFEKMKGEKIELDMSQLRGRGPGGPGGGGPGGRGGRPEGDRPRNPNET